MKPCIPASGIFVPFSTMFGRTRSGSFFGRDLATKRRPLAKQLLLAFLSYPMLVVFSLLSSLAFAQQPGQNVNMVSGTVWPYGDPFLERQDEPSLGVSTRNPLHLLAGANDYRTVDLNLPESDVGEGTLATPTGEPWVGEYISTDGGARWQSTLLPGYPQDTSPQGLASPLHIFTTAADPVIASGTNGIFYYGGIAFNRGSSLGTVFVARFMDLNNKENGTIEANSFPIRYINTVPVAYGTASPSDFLDKPWIAADIPRGSATCSLSVTQSDGSVVNQTIPAGNVYAAYANVATSSTGVVTSTIYFSRSTNCGATWSTPIALSKGYAISQGATIQVDPESGIVYVAWRVIHNTATANDAIAITASLNGGESFLPALTVVSLPPFNIETPTAPAFFDQNTTETSFRTTAYPALAVADSGIPLIPGPLYLAWSQRGVGPDGNARIMMLAVPGNASFTSSGFKPPTPFPVDNGAITNDVGGTFPALTVGDQIMPIMTFNQGNLMLVYYDLRQDHTIGEFTPNVLNGEFTPDANGNFFEETRDEVEEFPTSAYSPYFISDAGLTVRRHTIDVVLAQSTGQGAVPKFNYVRVSHYDFGLFEGEESGETAPFHQLKFDPPNLPMFETGEAAFLGDYIGITGQPFVLVKCGSSQCWTYNNPSPPGVAGTILAAPKPAPTSAINYATWTSNQDVIPPPNNEWDTYTAINNGGSSVYNPSQPVPTCQNGFEGDRNQNVYMSRISQGLLVTSPQVSKPLSSSIQRGFVILVQNATSGRSTAAGFVNYFRLTIANQPANGFASFAQFVPPSPVPAPPFPKTNNGITFPLTSIDVAVAPHTGVARTVFAVSSSSTASIQVNVNEITGLGGTVISGGMSSFLLLNADGTVPSSLVDPNGANGSNSITDVELYNPNVSAPNVSAPNVSAPNVSAPNVSAPNVSAPNVSAPNVSAPNVSAAEVTAEGVANPNVSAPNVSAPNVSAAPPSDGTFTVTNTGNTTASYNVALTGSTSTPLQLLLSQVYMTPQTDGFCTLITQQQDITLANVPNVPLTSVNSLPNPNVSAAPVTEPTFSLEPGDTAYITIRGNVSIAAMQQIVTQVSPVIVPQAVNSNSTTITTPPTIYPPISILTTSLPPTDRNDAGYSVQLQSAGGKPGTATWSLLSGSFPSGITLSPSGLISGTAGTPGSFPVTIKVADTNSPADTATQSFTLNVSVTPLTAQVVMPPPDGVVGQSYLAIPLTVIGGTPPYNFSAIGLPAGLSINPSTGQITGIPTIANPAGSPVAVTATDSASPIESVSYNTTIPVGTLIQISPASSTLPAGTLGLSYTFQLSASGGIGGLVFGPAALPAGGTLSSNGLISFTNPQTSTVTFTVSVHDQANPNQVQTATYTINFAPFSAGNLTFVTPPSNTPVGQVISPAVQVEATNLSNAVIPNLAITISLNSGPGTLSGTLTQITNASGIATFPGFSVSAAGTGDTLKATAGTVSATSAPFNITSTPQACAPVPGAPIAWWPFNGNALDIRGGKPGTILGDFGTQSVFVPGEVGQGFKSTGEGVLISYPTTLYLTPVNFTLGAWIRVDSETNDATEQIVWQGDSGNADFTTTPYSLGVLGNGTTAWATSNSHATIIGTAGAGKVVATFSDGVNELDMFSNTVLTTGTFYYVAITWNGPGTGAVIWINGVADQISGGTALSGLVTPANPFQIGGIQGNGIGTESFNGVIDELQIWNAGINQFQLATIYKAGSAGECQAVWFTETNGPGNTTNIGYVSTDGSTIKEYTPPSSTSTPYGIVAGPDGNMWFTEEFSGNIGLFNPGTSTFTEYTLGLGEETGIVSGPDGTLWFLLPDDVNATSSSATVASIGTNGTGFRSYQNFSADFVQTSITAGPDGNLWITEGTEGPGKIAQVSTIGSTYEFSPTTTNTLGPVSITTGPDGNLWFLNAGEVVAITTLGVTNKDFVIPNGLSQVALSVGGSGYQVGDVVTVVESGASGGTLQISIVDTNGAVLSFNIASYGTGYAAQPSPLTTTGGHGTGFTVNVSAVAANAIVNSIALGPDGNLWFTGGSPNGIASGANNIFQLTTAGQFTAFPGLPGGSPNFITAGPDGNIWFTDFNNNAIGRLTLSTDAVAEFPTPTTNSNPWGIGTGPAVIAVPAPPTNVSGSSPFGSPVISWTASVSTGVIGYNVYRSPVNDQSGPFTLVNSSPVTSSPFTDLGASTTNCGTNTFYYFVTTVGTGQTESQDSNETSAPVQGPC
jgi:streptogramin lyase